MKKETFGDMNKLRKALSYVFNEITTFDLEKTKETEDKLKSGDKVVFADMSNVCCIYFNKPELTKWFVANFEFNIMPCPPLDYEIKEEKKITACKYPTEYMTRIMKIFETWDSGVKITMKSDYPATFENEDFIIILAPRI